MNGIQVVALVGAFVSGLALSFLGGIKFSLAKWLGSNEAKISGLLAALNLTLIPAVLASGIVADLLGGRLLLVLGSLSISLALFGLTVRRAYRWAVGCILLSGLGAACVGTASIVLLPQAFSSRQPAAALNLGSVFFGLGALMAPTLAEVLLRVLNFRRALGLAAVLGLAPALVAALPFVVEAPPPAPNLSVFSDASVWLAALVFFFYGPVEGALATWTSTYLNDLGYGEQRAARFLTGFWLTFLGARLLAAFLQQSGIAPASVSANAWTIVALGLLAAVALGNLSGAPNRTMSAVWLLALAVCLGPIFPTVIGIVFQQTPTRVHGTAYGTVFAAGSVGSLLLPPLIGAYARERSVQVAFRVPILLALGIAAAALVVTLR